MGFVPGHAQIKAASAQAGVSTASMGKFDERLAGEKPGERTAGRKRQKFEAVAGRTKAENEKVLLPPCGRAAPPSTHAVPSLVRCASSRRGRRPAGMSAPWGSNAASIKPLQEAAAAHEPDGAGMELQ